MIAGSNCMTLLWGVINLQLLFVLVLLWLANANRNFNQARWEIEFAIQICNREAVPVCALWPLLVSFTQVFYFSLYVYNSSTPTHTNWRSESEFHVESANTWRFMAAEHNFNITTRVVTVAVTCGKMHGKRPTSGATLLAFVNRAA